MSESTSEHVNGTAPAAPPAEAVPCDDCVTGGERALAVVAALFGVFIILVALDMFTGGKVGGFVREQVQQ